MNMLKNLLNRLMKPSTEYSLGLILVCGALIGILGFSGFHFTLDATSTQAFCTSCHEMADNSYAEAQEKIHATNRTGIEVTCSDCHVPHDFVAKMFRKIEAAREVYHHLLGTIDTKEKYDAYRPVMIARVYDRMHANDSANCRYCHQNVLTKLDKQKRRARVSHQDATAESKTCIDCHQGIAHQVLEIATEEPAQDEDFSI